MRYSGQVVVLLAFALSSCQSAKVQERAVAGKILDSSGYLYDPADRSCGGFPRLEVGTAPGTCLGLVLPRDRAKDPAAKASFIKPRTILPIAGTDRFLVVDMGGWGSSRGMLFLLRPSNAGPYELKLLKGKLNKPHGLARGPDGFVYLGESDKIWRFRVSADGALSPWQLVTDHLPRFEGHMHPLTQFTFDPRNGDLFINSGAPTDHCFVAGDGYKVCPETESKGLGAIYRIPGRRLRELPAGGVRIFEHTASGLRNSMAMVVHPSGTLVQGENSRDFPELEEPYEEINVIEPDRPGLHYGWPYCYNFNATSPEWVFPDAADTPLRRRFTTRLDCSSTAPHEIGEYQPPHALIPPHAAPLHMEYYSGAMFPELRGKLLMGWHGYQPTGHRLVAYDVDERGRPKLADAKAASYSFDQQGGCAVRRAFSPKGGMLRHAPYSEIISQWESVEGTRPNGAPVGFTQAADGSLWIVEDRDVRAIVRLAKDDSTPRPACVAGAGGVFDPRVKMLAWRNAVAKTPALLEGYRQVDSRLLTRYCAECHGGVKTDDVRDDRFSRLDFMTKNNWFVPGKPQVSHMATSIAKTGETPPMPPGGSAQFLGTRDGDALVKLVSDWIKMLPKDIEKRYRQAKSPGARVIRDRAGAAGRACGAITAEDFVWIDPRPETQAREGGWLWSKVYLLPNDSRLVPGKCAFPDDGVFFIALRKL